MKKRLSFISIMLSVLLVLPTFAISFADISGHWAEDAVNGMAEKGIVNGYQDGTFKPEGTVTRAEFVKMFDGILGLTEKKDVLFKDVNKGDWFCEYVEMAYADGYLLEYGENFQADTPLSREEAAALLSRGLKLGEDKLESSLFADYSEINTEYATHVLKSAYAGLLKGYTDGKFYPKNTLTRAEAATILHRASDYKPAGGEETNDKPVEQSQANAEAEDHGFSVYPVYTSGDSGRYIKFTTKYSGKIYFYNTSDPQAPSSEIFMSFYDKAEIKDNYSVRGNKEEQKLIGKDIPDRYLIVMLVGDDGKQYTPFAVDSSASITNVLKNNPVYASNGSESYLTFNPVFSGKVYYFHTKSKSFADSESFMQVYLSSESRKTVNIVKDKINTIMVEESGKYSSLGYLAIMFENEVGNKYSPYVITKSEKGGAGFIKGPVLSMNDKEEKITYTPSQEGVLLYYYENEFDSLAYSSSGEQFLEPVSGELNEKHIIVEDIVYFNKNYFVYDIYSATLSNNTGYADYKSLLIIPFAGINMFVYFTHTKLLNYISILKLFTGKYYSNAINRKVAYENGYTDIPLLSDNESGTYVTLKPNYDGKIEYYLTNTASSPSTDSFVSQKDSAKVKGSFDAEAGINYITEISSAAEAKEFKYAAFMLTDSNGKKYSPITIKLP